MRFADTSFWVALQFARDRHHEEARALWRDGGSSVVSSNLVLGETWTFLRRRLGHPQAIAFLDRVYSSPRVTIKKVTDDLEGAAWRWLRRHDERDYSFVDATSFMMMNGLRLSEALAFDGDFTAAGFSELRR